MGGARVKNGHGDGVASELQAALAAVREGLADLHRRLLEPVRRAYEAEHGRIAGPGELLRLLTQHAHFAWLRQLSELLADLDALADERPTQELGAAVRAAAEALVMAPKEPGEPGDFWRNYSPLLQDAEVAVAHGQVRKLLAGLPDASRAGARTLRERHQAALAKKRR
jgi:hypothetical protein